VFKKTGPNAALSDEGFFVKRLTRNSLEYREGNRSLIIEVEPGIDLAIYKDSIQTWNQPEGRSVVASQEKQRILDNVQKAMAFLGINFTVW